MIIVNQSFEGGILEFIPRLAFEAVILIDEAEKTFSEKDDAHYLLKLIDGVYNRSRKLYVLTTNKLHINENLLGRPGRIRYIQEFTNLPREAVEEYLDDNLKDKSKKDEILETIDVLEISTIDILKSIVEEFNIFGDIGGDHGMMNIPRSNYVYDAIKFSGYSEEDLEKVREIIRKNKPADISISDWFDGKKNSTSKNVIDEKSSGSSVAKKRSGKLVTKEVEEVTEETIGATDLFNNEEDGRCAYAVRITSKYSDIIKHTETNQGQVLTDPTKDGFVLIKDYWGEDVNLYLILRQKKTISVYNNYNLV